jgi:hypothetical protein
MPAQPAGSTAAYAVVMNCSPADPQPAEARPARRLACFHPEPAAEPLLRDWLQPSRDALFRWTMAMATSDDGRRSIAQTAVAVQRLGGADDYSVWLYGAALQAACHQQRGLPEASLVGLPPELRALLRLVALRLLRREEALAWLAQRMDFVRGRLVQARLAGQSAPLPLDGHAALPDGAAPD